MDWSEVSVASEANDPNLAYAIFYDLFKNAYDRVFPLKQISERKTNAPKQPWMTCGLLKSCRKKAKLYLKCIKNPNAENKAKFTRYRNNFRQNRIRAKLSSPSISGQFSFFSSRINTFYYNLK